MEIKMDNVEKNLPALWLEKDRIRFIDQRKLPYKLEFFDATTVEECAFAIKDMVVRGAPSIGAAGAYGIAVASITGKDMNEAGKILTSSRPTANDIFYAVDFMKTKMKEGRDAVKSSKEYAADIINRCRNIGKHGGKLLSDGDRALTHCNAGALATVDYGTALAPFRKANESGKELFVYVDETRPRLQGRLTAWELTMEKIEHRIIPDNASGYFIKKGKVDIVITGADRIAANGDAANKIGTYEKAVVAKENNIPFYIAAPASTFDLGIRSGEEIEIEFRNENEVLEFQRNSLFGKDEKALNPAFDVTPARYITGFITEHGIFTTEELGKFFSMIG